MVKYVIHYIGGLEAQIYALLCAYPNLDRAHSSGSIIKIAGSIEVNKSFNGFTVAQSYKIEIHIPRNEESLPYVIDTGNHIVHGYPHIYQNRSLCLATEIDMRLHYIEGFELVDWMSMYVENYYFSYEYYQRYGVFPFGERGHGYNGILESYQEIFGAETDEAAKNILTYLVSHKTYRGHHLCPCGSGKKIRNCHKEIIQRCLQDPRISELLIQDYNNNFLQRKEGKNERNT